MTAHCPDCLEPVDVSPTAREGRCEWCRPQRIHSKPNSSTNWTAFIYDHNRRTP